MVSDTDDRFDPFGDVVATSGDEDPRETVAALLGDPREAGKTGERLAESGVTLSVEDYLGHDERTRHELHLEDGVEYLPCVADALEAALLVDEDPVVVRSIDPVADEPIVFEVAEDDLDVTPPDAVVSVGMDAGVPDSTDMTELTITASCGDELPGGRDPAEFPSVVCAYINAFESVETYEEWADEVEAVSVALPAGKIVSGIREFVAGPAFD